MDNKSFDRLSTALAGTSTRRQAFKLLGGGIVGGLVAAKGLSSVEAAPKTIAPVAVPVNFADVLGSFAGTFSLEQFTGSGDGVQAVGTLTGTVTATALGLANGVTSGLIDPQALTLDLLFPGT